MSVMVFFEGKDNTGKTTQIREIIARNPAITEAAPDLSAFSSVLSAKAEEVFLWWFSTSSPREFCHTLLNAYKKRMEYVCSMSAPFIFIDKGIHTIKERILATLIFRGLSTEEATEILTATENELDLLTENGMHFRFTEMHSPEVTTRSSESSVYDRYQSVYQAVSLPFEHSEFLIPALSVSEVTSFILKEIKNNAYKYINGIRKDFCIVGISGMSESGKSTFGKNLDLLNNVWNTKIGYFEDLISQRYNISLSKYYHLDEEFTGYLLGIEINRFMKHHYYKQCISIESLHSYTKSECLQKLFGKKYSVVYLQVSDEQRVQREYLLEKENHSLYETWKKVIEKDNMKRQHGIKDFERTSDVTLLNNNFSMAAFVNRTLSFTRKQYFLNGDCLSVDALSCPDAYKKAIAAFIKEIQKFDEIPLLGIVLTGSCAFSCTVPGFSDIDFLIVLEKVTFSTLVTIHDISKKSEIKIGYTTITRNELKHGLIDPKTRVNLLYLQRCELFPLIWNRSVSLPEVEIGDIIKSDVNNQGAFIHELRRAIVTGDNLRKCIKEFVKIIKLCLGLHGITNIHDYESLFRSFAEYSGVSYFDISRFLQNIDSQQLQREFYEYVLDVIDIITNGYRRLSYADCE